MATTRILIICYSGNKAIFI